MRKAVIAVVVLIVVAAFSSRWHSRLKQEVKPRGAVSAAGYVVDADGRLVVGAEVIAVNYLSDHSLYQFGSSGAVKPKAEVVARVVTGKDGSFEFRGLPEARCGMYYLIARKPGKYLGWTNCPVEYIDDTPICPNPHISYRIVANKLEKQTGRVISSANKPVRGVRVDLVELEPMLSFSETPPGLTPCYPLDKCVIRVLGIKSSTQTDNQGNYCFDALPKGSRGLFEVSRPGVQAVGPKIVRHGPVLYPDLPAPTGGSIRGRVVDIKGKPVAGISILARSDDAFAVAHYGTAITGKDGAFVVRNMPRAHYRLDIVGSDRYALDTTKLAKGSPYWVNVESGADMNVSDILAIRRVPVTGRLVGKDTGKPIVGARVVGDSYASYATTDKLGRFRLWLVPGLATIHYVGGNPLYQPSGLSPRYRPEQIANHLDGHLPDAAITVDVPAKGLSGVEVKPERARMLRGMVVDQEGKPVPGALLSLGDCPANWTHSRRDGRFEISLCNEYGWPLSPPYRNSDRVVFRVRDRVNNRSFTTYVGAQDANKEMRVVVTPQAKVRVVVHDLKGRPVKDAIVSVNHCKPGTTDSNGCVLFSDLINYPVYWTEVIKPGYLQISDSDLAAIRSKKVHQPTEPAQVGKDRVRMIDATMVPTRCMQKGKVVDVNGKPVAGINVGIRIGTSLDSPIQTVTDSRGEFVLKNVPEVPVKITAGDYYTGLGLAMSGPEYVVIKVLKPNFSGR